MNKNLILTKIADEISMDNNEIKKIKNKINILINEISNEFHKTNINLTYIGSYGLRTVVNYKDNEVDIDCMLTFPKKIANQYNLYNELIKILKKYSKKIKQKIEIKEKEKVIQIIYNFNDKTKNYHIDFPITYDSGNKKHLILKNNNSELTEAHKIRRVFNQTFNNDAKKLIFHKNVIKLFKRWVKTNADNLIPSIAISQSCIQINKNNNNDILSNLISNVSNIYNSLKTSNKYKLIFEPKNDIFKNKNKSEVKIKLINFLNQLQDLKNIENEKKFVEKSRKYFLGNLHR